MTKRQVSRTRGGRGPRLALAGVCAAAFAAGSARADEAGLIEKLEHGQIDWTAKTVVATGSGAPNLKLENVAQVRLAAERAAKLDAYRNVLEALKGVRITAGKTGQSRLADVQVRTQVQGIVRNCKTVDTRYYSDGGVDVVIECALDGGLATALVPVEERKDVRKGGDAKYSGLVVNAVGLGAKPALAPRLVVEGGEEIYSPAMVGPNHLRRHGAARYVTSVEQAKKDPRIGDSPLVVEATGLGDADTDIRLAAADAAKLEGVDLGFLTEGRVVIATDAP